MKFPIAKGAKRVEDPLEDVTEFSIKYFKFENSWISNNYLIHRILEIPLTYLNIYEFRIKAFQIHNFKIKIKI